MKIFYFFIFFVFINSFFYPREKAFLIYNKDFHDIFPDYKRSSYAFEKMMYRKFFEIQKIEISDYLSLKMELDRIIIKNKSGIFVLDDFLSPMLLKDEGTIGNKKFKMITYNIPNDYKFGTVGKPWPNVEVKITPDGEILTRSDCVMQGYYKNKAETEK
ncbi:MAG TPA: AMP-binding protein, partial [Spirochaetota bacterium]|nr:AMP-binding protein [Spirochaetota bacterium]